MTTQTKVPDIANYCSRYRLNILRGKLITGTEFKFYITQAPICTMYKTTAKENCS